MKYRTRKGIPVSLRGYVYQLFAEVDKINPKINYQQLISNKLDTEHSKKVEREIIKDLSRTFPENTFFRDKFGLGQQGLFNILSTFAQYKPKIGYVQGMGFIPATFLNYMSEEESFWMLVSVMDKYELKEFYYENFPELPRTLYKFLNLFEKNCKKVYDILVIINF